MIKIEDVEVIGMRKAIKGMRNAMNSWDKSDSYPAVDCKKCGKVEREGVCRKEDRDCTGFECYAVGEKDMELAKRLIKTGSSDRKFMRMIHVQADVTAPLYWWKQADQYRIGVTTNSTSTMHTIHKRDLTTDDFSHEHLLPVALDSLNDTIKTINTSRQYFIDMKLKEDWCQMIQLLPSSYNQMRTIDLSYENLFNIYHQRKNHKLNEWVTFCKWIENLPYMKEFLEI